MMRPQAMRSEAWLEIANGEAWLSGKPVLRNLNLKLWLGESTTILGPNGAGKSSLVKLIDRSLHPIVRPQAELRLFGQTNVNLWDLRQRIGVVTTELEGRFPPSAAAREVVSSRYFGSMRLGRSLRKWKASSRISARRCSICVGMSRRRAVTWRPRRRSISAPPKQGSMPVF